jgi:hypothetical protein
VRVETEQHRRQAAEGGWQSGGEMMGMVGRGGCPAGVQADELAQQLDRPPANVPRQVGGEGHGPGPLRCRH